MRLVSSALLVAGIALFASGCCCNPLGLLGLCVPNQAVAAADRANLDEVPAGTVTTAAAKQAPVPARY